MRSEIDRAAGGTVVWPDWTVVCMRQSFGFDEETLRECFPPPTFDFVINFCGRKITHVDGRWRIPDQPLRFCSAPNDARRYACIDHATLMQGVVFKKGQAWRCHERYSETYVPDDAISSPDCRMLERVPGCVVSTMQPHTFSYCHWVAEALPKILRSQRLGLPGRLVVDDADYCRGALRILGVNEEKCVFVPSGRVALPCEKVILWDGAPFEELCLEDMALIRDAFHVPENQGDTGILLDRGYRRASFPVRAARRLLGRPDFSLPDRTVLNHPALLAGLQEHFSDLRWEVFPPYASFDEMLGLFRRAKVIVGPHGAGLINMLFAPQGTRVVELMPSGYPCNFIVLGHSLRNPYRCVAIEAGSRSRNGAFTVRPRDVIKQLESIL